MKRVISVVGVKWLPWLGVLIFTVTLSACATSNFAQAPDADLHKLKTFYVVHLPVDKHGIEKLISDRLTALGYESAYGDAQTPPSRVDAIITYQDHWMWDITMYMIKLDIQVHD